MRRLSGLACVLGGDRSFVDGMCHSAFLGLCMEDGLVVCRRGSQCFPWHGLGGETGRFYVLGGDRSSVDGVCHSAFLGQCWGCLSEKTGFITVDKVC